MSFNDEKCKLMVFKNRSYSELDFNISLKGVTINVTHVEKDLGVYITSDLKWTHQA